MPSPARAYDVCSGDGRCVRTRCRLGPREQQSYRSRRQHWASTSESQLVLVTASITTETRSGGRWGIVPPAINEVWPLSGFYLSAGLWPPEPESRAERTPRRTAERGGRGRERTLRCRRCCCCPRAGTVIKASCNDARGGLMTQITRPIKPCPKIIKCSGRAAWGPKKRGK